MSELAGVESLDVYECEGGHEQHYRVADVLALLGVSGQPGETHTCLWVNEYGSDGASTEVTGMHCAICDATLVKNLGAYGEVWE